MNSNDMIAAISNVFTNRGFGIEIETICHDGNDMDDVQAMLNRNGYGRWEVKYDCSLRGEAAEVVSPVLHGIDGLKEIQAVTKLLQEFGQTVNASCGLHVHQDARDTGWNNMKFHQLWDFYGLAEEQLDKLMPPSRRGNRNCFCRSITNREFADWDDSRYGKLNLCSFERHGSIEFRQHSGTLNPAKIIAWVIMTQAMTEYFLTGDDAYVPEEFNSLYSVVAHVGAQAILDYLAEREAQLNQA